MQHNLWGEVVVPVSPSNTAPTTKRVSSETRCMQRGHHRPGKRNLQGTAMCLDCNIALFCDGCMANVPVGVVIVACSVHAKGRVSS